MHEIWTLLGLELRSLYGINRFLHTTDPKEKGRSRLLIVGWVVIIGVMCFYVAGLVYGLCLLDLEEIVPGYLVVLSSALILAFGLFTAGNRIFGKKGYDLLASLPLRSGSIVISRFLCLYLEDLALTMGVLLPGLLTYGFLEKPGPGFYLAALAGAVWIPAIPLVLSVLLGTLVMAVSSRMKQKSLVQSGLMVVLVVGILFGTFFMGNTAADFTPEALAQLAQTVSSLLGRSYPPALWLGNAMAQRSFGGLGLLIAVSAGVTGLALAAVIRLFPAVQGRLLSSHARHSYQIGTLERRNLLKALYLREAKRYFSSSIYVTNTVIGPILGAVLAISLAVAGLEPIQAALPVDVQGILPFGFSAVFCMMTTTSCAISMEGRQMDTIKALPIPVKTWLDSKILLNLSLMAPFYALSVAAMAIGTRASLAELFWLAGIPGVILVFSVVFGITVNLKFHSFDWEKEETVVKQSLSAMVGGFAGFLVSILLAAVVLLVPPAYGNWIKALSALGVGLAALGLYRKNNTARLTDL